MRTAPLARRLPAQTPRHHLAPHSLISGPLKKYEVAPQVHAPDAIAPTIDMLTKFLASRIEAGVSLKSGQSIQCSWMWLKIGEDQNGATAVLAPKFGAMPMEFLPDCSDALNLVLTQKYTCDSFGIECSPCSAVQSAIVVKDLAECKKVFMNRTDDEYGHASGWFFGASDSKLDVNLPGSLELKSLWELSCDYPLARDFFLLPPSAWRGRFRGASRRPP